MAVHDFERRYAEADTRDLAERVGAILRDELDARGVRRADEGDDRRGVDFWALLHSGREQGVDVKARRREWGDLLVEIVSRDVDGREGWARDRTKLTDYVLFLWPRRHLLLPYPQLRATVRRREEAYLALYGECWASTRSGESAWRTLNVAVPEGRLFADMFGLPAPVGVPLTAPRRCPYCRALHPVGTTCAGGAFPWAGAAEP